MLAAAASLALVAGGVLWWQSSEDVTPVEVADPAEPTDQSPLTTASAQPETLLVSQDGTGELIPMTGRASRRQQFQLLGNTDPDAVIEIGPRSNFTANGTSQTIGAFRVWKEPDPDAPEAPGPLTFRQGEQYYISTIDWPDHDATVQALFMQLRWDDGRFVVGDGFEEVEPIDADLTPDELVALANSLVETPEPGQDNLDPAVTTTTGPGPPTSASQVPVGENDVANVVQSVPATELWGSVYEALRLATPTGERIVYSTQPDRMSPDLWTQEPDGTYWSHYASGTSSAEDFLRAATYSDGEFVAPGFRRAWTFDSTSLLWSMHNAAYLVEAFDLPDWDAAAEVGESVTVRGTTGVAVDGMLGGMVAWRHDDRVVLQVRAAVGGTVDEAVAVANRLVEIDEAAWLQIDGP